MAHLQRRFLIYISTRINTMWNNGQMFYKEDLNIPQKHQIIT